ncbi:MAG: hypothetical protein Q9220_002235 [cf. Caloplaca sp. 1 TL-2023]
MIPPEIYKDAEVPDILVGEHCWCLMFLAAAAAAGAHAADTCTTLQPVFIPPRDATSTVYATTATTIKGLDCDGCSLVVSTFSATTGTPSAVTPTITSPVTTSTEFYCQPSANVTSPTVSMAPPPTYTPTAVPRPPFNQTVQILVDEIRTAILYAELIGNGGNLPKLCSTINPAALNNETINGTIVQREVCAGASITIFFPSLSNFLVLENQLAVGYLETALFAVQTVANGYVGGSTRQMLCSEIDEVLINNIFVGYVEGTGTIIKHKEITLVNMFGSSLSSGMTLITMMLMRIRLAADEASFITMSSIPFTKTYKPRTILTIGSAPSMSALPNIQTAKGSLVHLLLGLFLLALLAGLGSTVRSGITKLVKRVTVHGHGVGSAITEPPSTNMGHPSAFPAITSPAISTANHSSATDQGVIVQKLELMNRRLRDKSIQLRDQAKEKDDLVFQQQAKLNDVTRLLDLSHETNRQLTLQSQEDNSQFEKKNARSRKELQDQHSTHELWIKDSERRLEEVRSDREMLRSHIVTLQRQGFELSKEVPLPTATQTRTYFAKYLDESEKCNRLRHNLSSTQETNEQLLRDIEDYKAIEEKLKEELKFAEDAVKQVTTDLQATKAGHKTAVDELRENIDQIALLEDQKTVTKKQHEREIENIRKQHGTQISLRDVEKASARKYFEEKASMLEEENVSALDKSELKHQSDLAALKSKHDEEIKKLKGSYKKVREEAKKAVAMKVDGRMKAMRSAVRKAERKANRADEEVAATKSFAETWVAGFVHRAQTGFSEFEQTTINHAQGLESNISALQARADRAEGQLVKTEASLKEQSKMVTQRDRALGVVRQQAEKSKAKLVVQKLKGWRWRKEAGTWLEEEYPHAKKDNSHAGSIASQLDRPQDIEASPSSPSTAHIAAQVPLPPSPPSTPALTSPILAPSGISYDALDTTTQMQQPDPQAPEPRALDPPASDDMEGVEEEEPRESGPNQVPAVMSKEDMDHLMEQPSNNNSGTPFVLPPLNQIESQNDVSANETYPDWPSLVEMDGQQATGTLGVGTGVTTEQAMLDSDNTDYLASTDAIFARPNPEPRDQEMQDVQQQPEPRIDESMDTTSQPAQAIPGQQPLPELQPPSAPLVDFSDPEVQKWMAEFSAATGTEQAAMLPPVALPPASQTQPDPPQVQQPVTPPPSLQATPEAPQTQQPVDAQDQELGHRLLEFNATGNTQQPSAGEMSFNFGELPQTESQVQQPNPQDQEMGYRLLEFNNSGNTGGGMSFDFSSQAIPQFGQQQPPNTTAQGLPVFTRTPLPLPRRGLRRPANLVPFAVRPSSTIITPEPLSTTTTPDPLPAFTKKPLHHLSSLDPALLNDGPPLFSTSMPSSEEEAAAQVAFDQELARRQLAGLSTTLNDEGEFVDEDDDAEAETDEEEGIVWEPAWQSSGTFDTLEPASEEDEDEGGLEAAYSEPATPGPSSQMTEAFRKGAAELKVEESAVRSTIPAAPVPVTARSEAANATAQAAAGVEGGENVGEGKGKGKEVDRGEEWEGRCGGRIIRF